MNCLLWVASILSHKWSMFSYVNNLSTMTTANIIVSMRAIELVLAVPLPVAVVESSFSCVAFTSSSVMVCVWSGSVGIVGWPLPGWTSLGSCGGERIIAGDFTIAKKRSRWLCVTFNMVIAHLQMLLDHYLACCHLGLVVQLLQWLVIA